MAVMSFSLFTKLKRKTKINYPRYTLSKPLRFHMIARRITPIGIYYNTIVTCKEIDYLFLTKATSTTWAFFLIERNDLGTKKKKKNKHKFNQYNNINIKINTGEKISYNKYVFFFFFLIMIKCYDETIWHGFARIRQQKKKKYIGIYIWILFLPYV